MKERLDVWLVEHGLAESREKAQALVMAGRVRMNGQPVDKPGTPVPDDASVEVLPGPEHVGRGAVKLVGALDVFGIDPAGKTVVDIGASTGGFTEVLLSRGARRVYAVDVGRGQLHERLRADPRVVVKERLNARYLSAQDVPEPCELGTMDVSFISVLKVLPSLRNLLASGADMLVLVKPQFEVGRFLVDRGGLVKDPGLHTKALGDVAWAAQHEMGYALRGAAPSPITGAEGNREFFLHLVREGELMEAARVSAVIDAAVRQ